MLHRRVRALAAALPVAVLVAACGGGGESGESDKTLTVWTVEDQAERVEAQKRILADFTQSTGIKINLVAVAEDQLTSVLTSAAAANKLPDLINAISLAGVNRLLTDDLLDTDAAGEIVEELGEGTFSQRSLELTRNKDTQLAVPSDGWAQLLYYRKDLFSQAGLAAPDTYDAISKAAAALDRGQVAGIVAGTAPGDSFTQQTVEPLAIANGCELVDDKGEVTLDTPNCVETFRFFGDLIRDHSVPGNQDADTTRASYFAGKAAMVVWSSFLLDELAGLRDDALPTCAQCKADKTFLAKNTGVVSALRGPNGTEPATFGEIVSWAVLRDAATDDAKELVRYMMADGYEKWLAIAPEGKVPTRKGTEDDAQRYQTAWQKMQAGVDRKAPLSQFYGPEVLDAVTKSPETFRRWGLQQGQGELTGAVAGQFVVPKALQGVLGSGGDPAKVAKTAADQAKKVKQELGS
jgi:multiple sugar transport system substrate-binding protein